MQELLKVLQLLDICLFHSSNCVTNPHRREEYIFSIFCTSRPWAAWHSALPPVDILSMLIARPVNQRLW